MSDQSAPRCVGVRLTVAELDRSAAFYADLFGFEYMTATADEIVLRMGDTELALRLAAPQALRTMPPDSSANDLWFRHIAIVVRDMAAAYARLQAHGVELISSTPQTLPGWNPASAGIEALYFRDPDGHPLELLRFPPDKGKAVWRESGEELFLGIDHSAIVVADTAASLVFYRDEIGLSVVAEAHNHGVEQAALSGLPDAHVRVTSLLGRGTFGLELMQYVAPPGGRQMPVDTGVDDLWWAETLIESAYPKGERRLARDPDGHTGEIR